MNMAPSFAQCFLCSLLFLSISSSIAKTPSNSRPRALILEVIKDPLTKQYITQINQRTPFVPLKLTVDLGGEALWVDCNNGFRSSTYKPAHCGSSLCSLVKNNGLDCGGVCSGSPRPGCNNNTCSIFHENRFAPAMVMSELGKDIVSLQSTDGSNPGHIVEIPKFAFACGSARLQQGLAKGVKGMAGLGRTSIGMPSQFSHAFRFPRKFGMCLSSKGKGVIFFGDGPYVMLPGIDISQRLTYTPLIFFNAQNVIDNDRVAEYYIGVKGINVNGIEVPINTALLKLNKQGYEGTQISTDIPYTALETSIYKAVTNAFTKSLSKIPRMKPVAPFDVCYNASSFESSRVGPNVPPIELVLQNGKTSWTFIGANSMVAVKRGLLCLAFVDGGSVNVNGIVIGGHQLENAFLQFDLGKSRLGFIPTILGVSTTCANFNFTSIA